MVLGTNVFALAGSNPVLHTHTRHVRGGGDPRFLFFTHTHISKNITDKINIEELPHKYANRYGWNVEHSNYINKAVVLNTLSIEDNILLQTLNSLKLNKIHFKKVQDLLKKLGDNYTSIHMRIEKDWPKKWEPQNEDKIINAYS